MTEQTCPQVRGTSPQRGPAKLPDGERAQGGIVLYGAPIGDSGFVRAFLAAARHRQLFGRVRGHAALAPAAQRAADPAPPPAWWGTT